MEPKKVFLLKDFVFNFWVFLIFSAFEKKKLVIFDKNTWHFNIVVIIYFI